MKEKASVQASEPNPEPENTMKTLHLNPASTCATSPARPKFWARLFAKTLPAFLAGLFVILSIVFVSIPRMEADPPSISVTDNGTQVDGSLNITGDLLKNGVPLTLSATLAPATTTTLGGVKVGANLSITPDGILSATGGGNSLINASIVEAADATNAATLSQQNPSILYVVPKTETIDGSVWFAGKLIVGERPSNPTVLLTPAMTDYTAPAPFAVTCSSTWDNNAANAAWRCFDQMLIVNNAWSSHNITDAGGYVVGCWITIDLGATRTLARVALAARCDSYCRDSARQFRVEVSTDGATWKTVHESPDLGPTQPNAGQIYYDQTITPALGRYIRLTINRTFYPNENVSMGEIYYYGY